MALGGRRRILESHAALVASIAGALPRLRLSGDASTPVLASPSENLEVHGFGNDDASRRLHAWLEPALPDSLPASHFRVVRDYVTRWIYPHTRPDLGPLEWPVAQRQGFHGQHKDAIAEYPDPVVRERLMAAYRPGLDDIVIDCGCFIGLGAIRMTRDAPRGRVYAVEASSACHALLARNVTVNGADRVTPMHNAIWNEATVLDLGTTTAQGNSLIEEVVDRCHHERVSTVTIDGIVERFALPRVDMISLTLNGAEIEGLQGAARTLREMRPRIRAAGWYMREGRRLAELLPPILDTHGYDTFVGPRGGVLALPRSSP